MQTTQSPRENLWTGPHWRTVAGIFSLAFLIAFESLAVSTIMPVVALDLHGLGSYSLAFAVPSAVAVISMTIAGPVMDRHGPGSALRAGVGIFAIGLIAAGLAPSMPIFLAGRAVQGFGIGLIGVGLYVVIGQVFPEHLRARVFTVMTSAWTLPGLIGPAIAGTIASQVGWRWVFLGVPALAVASLMLSWDTISRLGGSSPVIVDRRRIWWALIAAAGIVVVSVAGQRAVTWWPVLLVGATGATLVFAARLLPAGTLRGARGLPSVIASRSLLSAAYFGAETYVPLSLVQHRGLSPTQAGLFLTSAALLWFTGSWLAANLASLDAKRLRVRLGAACVLVGIVSAFLTLDDSVPIVLIAAVWSIGGLGMGLAASTLGVLLLDHSAAGEQGTNSAAMQTSDAVAQSLLLALGSAAFAIMLSAHATTGYVLVLSLAAAAGVGAILATLRVEAP